MPNTVGALSEREAQTSLGCKTGIKNFLSLFFLLTLSFSFLPSYNVLCWKILNKYKIRRV